MVVVVWYELSVGKIRETTHSEEMREDPSPKVSALFERDEKHNFYHQDGSAT